VLLFNEWQTHCSRKFQTTTNARIWGKTHVVKIQIIAVSGLLETSLREKPVLVYSAIARMCGFFFSQITAQIFLDLHIGE
jgi:phage head maturation protease